MKVTSETGKATVRRDPGEVYQNLADALNRLTRETGVVAMSINFNRSDVPLDWNDDIGGWAVEG